MDKINKMKTFRITEEAQVTSIWMYVVEAENEEEALNRVLSGKVNAIDMITEVDDNTEFTYNIEDENEK